MRSRIVHPKAHGAREEDPPDSASSPRGSRAGGIPSLERFGTGLGFLSGVFARSALVLRERLRIPVLVALAAGCRMPTVLPETPAESRWVLVEHRGVLAWVPEEIPLAVRSWVEHRPGVGQIGVVEVRTTAAGRCRIHAVPLRPDVVLLTPGVIECDGRARFEFTGPVPGRAGIAVWQTRE